MTDRRPGAEEIYTVAIIQYYSLPWGLGGIHRGFLRYIKESNDFSG